jgi:DNA-binding Lrp family transcriptional regulator
MKLDVIDLKILEALQKNSKITNIELSKVIGLSAVTNNLPVACIM